LDRKKPQKKDEHMEIINYNQEFEEKVVVLWNRTLVADPLTKFKFRKQVLFDDNFDTELCYVAIEAGKVVGFLLATKRKFPYLERGLEPTRGWINLMFVAGDYQHQGIGSKLVERAEAKLKGLGCETVTLGAYSPNYFFPGIDRENYQSAIKFFNALGYNAGEESYSMCKDLHGYKISEATQAKLREVAKEGFSFSNFEYKYALELLEFAKVEFGGGWKRNALLSMQNNNAEDCILLVLDKDQKICGFCMRMIDGNPMRFGPIGIGAAVRNYGLGGVLFDLMQLEMTKRGIYHLFFVSTDTPGRRFYERHGVGVFRTFVDYRKTF
jgi:ribosomal protein S18 acetylase RimI-like enzyme